MTLWLLLAINSITLGGLLFLLSAGFSLIFGLMRIPNLTHGSFFMLGAYLGVSFLSAGLDFWTAALASAVAMATIGGLIERLLLRRLAGNALAQVLVTLGLSFMIADICLMIWTGDPVQIETPPALRGVVPIASVVFPAYRLAIVLIAVVIAGMLWLMLDRTRLGAMIRAGVDDAPMARVVGIRVGRLFSLIFCLGAGLAGFGGVMGAPILSVYPGTRRRHVAARPHRGHPRRHRQSCSALSWAASSSAFSIISAKPSFPSWPTSSSSCPCWQSSSSARRASSAGRHDAAPRLRSCRSRARHAALLARPTAITSTSRARS